MEFPILILVSSFATLFLAAEAGNFLRIKMRPFNEDQREDFGIILGATLTLLGLLIGFSFSMAISRYDQRKLYEEAEANAIGKFTQPVFSPFPFLCSAAGLPVLLPLPGKRASAASTPKKQKIRESPSHRVYA